MMQGGRSIKAPSQVHEGDPVPVDVQDPGVTEVVVVAGGSSNEPPVTVPVGPGGRVTVPARPGWPAGTLLYVSTNTPPFTTVIVEIVPAS